MQCIPVCDSGASNESFEPTACKMLAVLLAAVAMLQHEVKEIWHEVQQVQQSWLQLAPGR